MTFNELNLSAPLLRAIAEAGYETPSPIQAKALPDLERQLPGGGEDQRPDGTRLAGLGGIEAVQHGQRESSGLAGARLGAAH